MRGRSRSPWTPMSPPGASRARSSVADVIRGRRRHRDRRAGHSVTRPVPARQLGTGPRILSGAGGLQRGDLVGAARRSLRGGERDPEGGGDGGHSVEGNELHAANAAGHAQVLETHPQLLHLGVVPGELGGALVRPPEALDEPLGSIGARGREVRPIGDEPELPQPRDVRAQDPGQLLLAAGARLVRAERQDRIRHGPNHAPPGRKKQMHRNAAGETSAWAESYKGGCAGCGRILFLCICVRRYRAPCFCSCTRHWTPPAAISSIPAATRVTNPSARRQRQLGGSSSSSPGSASCVAWTSPRTSCATVVVTEWISASIPLI